MNMTNIVTKISNDEAYMRRCIQLALNAEGRTYPNPMVGAVVVCDGRIIGEGWHHRAGEPHAEVNAIRSVADPGLLTRSTIYVSLEPCAHQGRTPPCADLIIRSGIPHVVVGCRDSFAKVDGRGIGKLRDAGVDVRVGVLEDDCRWLNRRFFTVQEKRRPYVILKWAQTADGYIGDIADGQASQLFISGGEAMTIEHRRRATEDAILVGAATVRTDDPTLTTRRVGGGSPLRFILSPNIDIPAGAKVLTDGGRSIVINRLKEAEEGNVKYVRKALEESSIAADALEAVMSEGATSVIVEGGRQTLSAFIGEELWDEAFVYTADKPLGHKGIAAPAISGECVGTNRVGECSVRHLVNKNL